MPLLLPGDPRLKGSNKKGEVAKPTSGGGRRTLQAPPSLAGAAESGGAGCLGPPRPSRSAPGCPLSSTLRPASCAALGLRVPVVV